MGNGLFSSSSVSNVIENNINDTNFQRCQASCSADFSGDVVIIDGSTVNGSVGFTESCSAKSDCMMQNTVDTNIQNIINSVINQANSTSNSLFNDFSFNAGINSADVENSTYNNITLVSQATCNSNASFSATNSLVYVHNSTINTGFAGFAIGNNAPADANSSCTMSNVAKIIAYNNDTSSTNQKNSVTGLWALIIICIVICVLIAGVVAIVVVATGGLSKALGKGKGADDDAALIALAERQTQPATVSPTDTPQA